MSVNDESNTKHGVLCIFNFIVFQGFCAPILGLSIVHMEYILNTNTHILAFAFTSNSIGYTIGGIICGIIYDHANKELMFSLCVMTEATMIIVSGFCGHIVAFLASMSLVGVAMGFIDTGKFLLVIELLHWFDEIQANIINYLKIILKRYYLVNISTFILFIISTVIIIFRFQHLCIGILNRLFHLYCKIFICYISLSFVTMLKVVWWSSHK